MNSFIEDGGRSRKYLDEIWSKNLLRGEPMTEGLGRLPHGLKQQSSQVNSWPPRPLLHMMPLLCFPTFPVSLHCNVYPSIDQLIICTLLYAGEGLSHTI